jgi:aryl-alcohol dehydrogenase-like predicted oxidoreductase
MDYQELGSAGLRVSRIILGTWAMGGNHWGTSSDSDSIEAMDAALEAGITAIDTAPAYGNGHAEELVGEVLRGRRERAVIATKGGLNMERPSPKDLSPEFLEKDLHNSLKRLQTDYIDLYQCHWPDTQTPMEKTMTALMRFREQGLIKNIGVCNFSTELLLEAMSYGEIVSVQPQYSLLKREIEKDLLPLCLEKKLGILSYGSLGAGVLSGKYKEPPQFGKGDARSFFYKFFKAQQWPSVNAVVDELRRIGSDKGAAPGHVAIAWILARRGITSAIVGARDPQQVRDNIRAMDVKLSEDDISALDEVSKGF